MVGAVRADIHIKVPAGNIMVWSTKDSLPGLPPSDATAAIQGVADLVSSQGTIAAFNPKTGLMAYHIGTSDVTFSQADFKFIPEVTINLVGKGTASGVKVSISSPNTADSATVDFKDGAKAVFNAVGAGTGTVEVKSDSKGSSTASTITNDLKPNSSGKLSMDVPINFAAAGTGASATSPSGAGGKAEAQAGAGGASSQASSGGANADANGGNAGKHEGEKSGWGVFLGQAVTLFLGVVIVAAVGYGLWWLFMKKPDEVAARLRALGAPIPQSSDPNSTPAHLPSTTPDPPKPSAPDQILLPDASIPAAGISPGIAAAPMAMGTIATEPTLTTESGTVFTLQEGQNAVGREPGLPISLNGESSVSRHHADVTRKGSELFVADVGSTNGTYVNGSKITGETQVQTGDVIQFGAVRVRVQA